MRLEGALTSRAAAYPSELCDEVARLAKQLATSKHLKLSTEGMSPLQTFAGSPGELRDPRAAQRFVSHLWATQLAESLPWRTIRAYKFPRANHINILEGHVLKTLVQIAPLNTRMVVFQDSLVTLGSHAKGRSSSQHLNGILRKSMAVQLAKNVYASGFHCPTWALRADDPSRQKRVRAPRVSLPAWFLALKTGKLTDAQDILDKCSGNPRSWGRWPLFGHAALLACSANYTLLVRGPRPSLHPRNRQDLEQGRVTRTTAAIRDRLWEQFSTWLEMEDAELPPLAQLARKDPIEVSIRLEEYGRVLYEQGETRRNYAETVNVVVQRHPFLKTFMAGPWRLLTTWESLNPGKVHPPFPLPLLQAAVTTALVWGWTRLALMMLLGFYALLRPCELIALRVSDCLLTSETGIFNVVFLKLQLVKSRTRGARQQSVRLDVPFVVSFLKKNIKVMTQNEKLWPYSASLFRRRLQQVLKATCDSQDICLPSSLRPGGATYWFRMWNEDLVRLQWRGRWLHFKTLAHYIQELGCVNVLDSLSPKAKIRVHSLAALCEPACNEVVPQVDLTSQVARLWQALRYPQAQNN